MRLHIDPANPTVILDENDMPVIETGLAGDGPYTQGDGSLAGNIRRAATIVWLWNREESEYVANRAETENEWLRRLLQWARARLKHASYQAWLDQYLVAGSSPAPEDEPPIIRSGKDDLDLTLAWSFINTYEKFIREPPNPPSVRADMAHALARLLKSVREER